MSELHSEDVQLAVLARLLAEAQRPVLREELAAVLAPLLREHKPVQLLRLAEAASILRCSTKTLKRRIEQGAIAAIEHGRTKLIHPDALDAYQRTNAVTGGNRTTRQRRKSGTAGNAHGTQ